MVDSRTGLSIQNCLTSKMKFLADMGISLRTVSWLRGDGYEVVHLQKVEVIIERKITLEEWNSL
ncbi:DUF5615 family PIN-like protein [Nostoc sp.]|uniref:DUF5615 family PIN-like protein n=1 Tax=Nostoc sp. TaxID=1180 RepID=UPI002FF87652